MAERSKLPGFRCGRLLVRVPLDTYILILNFSLPVLHSKAKLMQMKSNVTFIQSNRCVVIDIIFKKIAVVYSMRFSIHEVAITVKISVSQFCQISFSCTSS